MIEVAEELGYFTIQWSIDSLDWKDVSADFMVGRIMEKAGPGEIVLFHNAGGIRPRRCASSCQGSKRRVMRSCRFRS